MADTTLRSGSPGPVRPNTFRSGNHISNGISVDEGMAVTLFDEVVFSQANAANTANVAGLAATSGEFPGSVDIQYAGPFEMPAAQWDAITGQSGGLTAHAPYYLSPTTPGHLTTTKVTSGGNWNTPIGFALNATTLMIQIGTAIGPLS
jgi:hypothetical protein